MFTNSGRITASFRVYASKTITEHRMLDPFSERLLRWERCQFFHGYFANFLFFDAFVTKSDKMPSIEESESEEARPSSREFCTRDVEVLVQEIKENLRLSGFKSRPSYSRQLKATRPSPYRVPSRSRSWGDSVCDECVKAGNRHCSHPCDPAKSKPQTTDDPYEMLQELLRDGGLIKEAVRRLEIGISPKQRYLYDSDEECRTPFRVCNVDV